MTTKRVTNVYIFLVVIMSLMYSVIPSLYSVDSVGNKAAAAAAAAATAIATATATTATTTTTTTTTTTITTTTTTTKHSHCQWCGTFCCDTWWCEPRTWSALGATLPDRCIAGLHSLTSLSGASQTGPACSCTSPWGTHLQRQNIYSTLSISRGIVSPRNSEKTPHDSPVRVRYGVSFMGPYSEEF